MRIHRLDLIKYGKFTDGVAAFPAAPRDFHLIVGPNEAGKSTLRSAILDLLFGIHARSALAFRHPLSELRLGASIGNAEHTLEFQRSKALRQTLRSPDDTVLADNVLTPFLGTTDRGFFDQMFGLDHTRLIKGGNSILNAEDNVGQILFQSAAGIAGLGRMRDALIDEADKLWSPRKSAEREYYIAAQQLEQANAALKDATVRTRVWTDAHAKVEDLQTALDQQVAAYQQLRVRRERMERVRRTAPFRSALNELERELADLGPVVELAPDAAQLHDRAQRELATARQLLQLRSAELAQASAAIDALPLDQPILALAADVVALEERRLQYGAYERDIEQRRMEIGLIWEDVCQACAELGWATPGTSPEHDRAAEQALRQRLPTLLVRRELGQRMRAHSGLEQSLLAARQAYQAKLVETDGLHARLQALPDTAAPACLRAALSAARAFGDPAQVLLREAAVVARSEAVLQNAVQALTPWSMSVAALSAMAPPSPGSILRCVQQAQAWALELKAAHAERAADEADIARIELELSQFMVLHQPTTHDDVCAARVARDTVWSALKSGTTVLGEGAAEFERTVAHADILADIRLDSVEDATTLQALQHRLEQRRLGATQAAARADSLEQRLAQADAAWRETSVSLGLAGLPLEDMNDWLVKRQKVVEAAAEHQQAQRNHAVLCRTYEQALATLAAALPDAVQAPHEQTSLAALCMHAESVIAGSDSARVAYDMLSAQLQSAQASTAALAQKAQDAQRAVDLWSSAWTAAMAQAGFPADSPVGMVEGALELTAAIDTKLDEIRNLRVERIEAMQDDLRRFAAEAQRLADALAPALREAGGTVIARSLATRLATARQVQSEQIQLQALQRTAKGQVALARETIQTATASLAPLMARTGADSDAALSVAIARSDQKRHLQAQIARAQADLLQGGDGLTRQQIEREVDAVAVPEIAGELAGINDALAGAVTAQGVLSAELARAQQVFSGFQGAANAAEAEARRQEALARMADAAERFVKVHTAARLLRWSIERYREQKQGPMLARASAIFSQLTLGAFERLVVDFDRTPMTLEGRRAGGQAVGVAGMSDGTRDQLYLALRLAALELHLQQVEPLPFIADDLFVNYDDARSKAGLQALASLSERTQVIFLTHHEHLCDVVRQVFGEQVNIVRLDRSSDTAVSPPGAAPDPGVAERGAPAVS